jgi:DNA adenine methylase
MAETLFQWPGGKSGQYKRILKMMPHHECFVEAFGGSGVVTLNKPNAEVTVYNDLDKDLVHFFIVYREAEERLSEWLEKVKYHNLTYHDFAEAFYGWDDPESKHEAPAEPITDNLATPEDIEHGHIVRAGVFFTLRYMQFGAKYHGKSGFGRSKVQNGAVTFHNAKERLREFSGCWDHVTMECCSYEELAGPYDGPDTFWYFDPPYIGTEDYYRESDLDHQDFVEFLTELEGMWIVSYDTIPEELEQYHVTREESTNFIDSGMKGEGKDTVETIICNYDPEDIQGWTGSGQTGLGPGEWGTTEISTASITTNENGDDNDDEFLSWALGEEKGEKEALFGDFEGNGNSESPETETEDTGGDSESDLADKLLASGSDDDSGGFLEDAI